MTAGTSISIDNSGRVSLAPKVGEPRYLIPDRQDPFSAIDSCPVFQDVQLQSIANSRLTATAEAGAPF